MARLYWRPYLCRRHPRPPRSQRAPHRSRRREPETPTLQIDPKGLTISPQLCQKSTASRAPASQTTSNRNAGRLHLGISGRLRRNLHIALVGGIIAAKTAPATNPATPITQGSV